MSETQRQSPRYAVAAKIVVHARGQRTRVLTRGTSKNLSRGGLCALVDNHLDPATPIDLSISLIFGSEGLSESLSLPARVVWCTNVDRRFQIGVMFLPLAQEQQNFLDVFLRYLAQDKMPPLGDKRS